MVAHGCRDAPQIWTAGLTQLASSRVPAFTNAKPGEDLTSEKIGEPQLRQNRRSTGMPLLPASS